VPLYVGGIDSASFFVFGIKLWNYSDSVVFFVFFILLLEEESLDRLNPAIIRCLEDLTFDMDIGYEPTSVMLNKGNNKITEHRAIFQRERQNSYVNKQTKSVNNEKTGKPEWP
jgi:hypothetical protein